MPAILNFAAAALADRGGARGMLVPVEPVSAALAILLIQTGWYVFLGLSLALMLGVVAGRGVRLGDIFLDGSQVGDEFMAIGFAHALAYGPVVLMIIIGVQHISQVLDHVLTLTVLHLLATSLHTGFPTTMAWWFQSAVDAVVLALLGEIACARRDAYRFAAVSRAMESSGRVPSLPPATSPSNNTAVGGAAGSMTVVQRRAVPSAGTGSDASASPASPDAAPAVPPRGIALLPSCSASPNSSLPLDASRNAKRQ